MVNSAKILFGSWFAGLILVETIYFGSKLDNIFFLLSFLPDPLAKFISFSQPLHTQRFIGVSQMGIAMAGQLDRLEGETEGIGW